MKYRLGTVQMIFAISETDCTTITRTFRSKVCQFRTWTEAVLFINTRASQYVQQKTGDVNASRSDKPVWMNGATVSNTDRHVYWSHAMLKLEPVDIFCNV